VALNADYLKSHPLSLHQVLSKICVDVIVQPVGNARCAALCLLQAVEADETLLSCRMRIHKAPHSRGYLLLSRRGTNFLRKKLGAVVVEVKTTRWACRQTLHGRIYLQGEL
jgi:hypothetical protein